MMNRRQIFYKLGKGSLRAIFGAIGGIIAWILIEPFVTDTAQSISELFTESAPQSSLAIWAIGCAFIGISIVGLEESIWGNRQKAIRGAAIAGLVGFVGGGIAQIIGSFVWFKIFGPIVLSYDGNEFMQHFWLIIARSFTWALMGGIIGLSLGIVRGSLRGSINSAIGGIFGGFAGGVLFDTIAPLVGVLLTLGLVEAGWASRSIGLMLIGALIGLFSTVAEQFLSPATLKVISSGRMEGREFTLDKPLLTIGRDERCDVSLYYDDEILMRHALLQWEDGGYVITPEDGSKIFVNNLPVMAKKLEDGDVITVGKTRLLFRRRKMAPDVEISQKKVCKACGTVNRESAKYCRGCGNLLTKFVVVGINRRHKKRSAGFVVSAGL